MRTVTYYVASSVDGFIAHEDGSFDGFLPAGDHVPDYLKSLAEFDCVLMGRKTYEVGLKAGKTDPYPDMESYLFSRTVTRSLDERVHLVSEDAVTWVNKLKQANGGKIYLCGGATLAAALFDNGLIDEIVLKVNPFLMGAGIPLFADVVKQTALELLKTTVYLNGVVVVRYQVRA